MSSNHRDVYIIRGEQEGGADDEESAWLAPEPADEVIVEELLAASDLVREDVEPIEEHLDFADLHALLSGGDDVDDLTFTVEGWAVTVTHDGSITVEEAE